MRCIHSAEEVARASEIPLMHFQIKEQWLDSHSAFSGAFAVLMLHLQSPLTVATDLRTTMDVQACTIFCLLTSPISSICGMRFKALRTSHSPTQTSLYGFIAPNQSAVYSLCWQLPLLRLGALFAGPLGSSAVELLPEVLHLLCCAYEWHHILLHERLSAQPAGLVLHLHRLPLSAKVPCRADMA